MPDLYLQALMQGQILHTSIKRTTANKQSKNKFEIETEREIEAYLKTLSFDDEAEKNLFLTPELKRTRVKEELTEQAKLSELSTYLSTAFNILILKGNLYLTPEQAEIMNKDFENANKILDEMDLSAIPNENFQTLLSLSPATVESIFKIAVAKFNETRLVDSLSLFILLATLCPEEPDYWYRAGILAHASENYELAIRLYKTAASLDPTLIAPWIFIIDCYIKRDMQSEAEAAYGEAIKISETSQVEDYWKEMLSQQQLILKS